MIEVGAVDLRPLERGLAGLLRAGRDLTPVFRDARKPLRKDQLEHQKQERGPDGPWPQRAASTMRRAKGGKRRRARRMLGRLPGAIKIIADAHRIVGVSLVRWSGAHQEGGRVGRGSRLKKRTFLYPSGKLIITVAAMASVHLGRGWERG